MKTTTLTQRLQGGRQVLKAAVLFTTLCAFGVGHAEPVRHAGPGDNVVVESGEASRVTEQVRTAAPGTLVAVFVKPGDEVRKGQVLGHTELAPTKYQLDLARHDLENVAPLNALQAQAEAWTATREETEEAVRRRKAEKTRLDWAIGMEKFHHGNYQARLEQKKLERIKFEHWTAQYEARFLRAPVEGVVTEVRAELGKSLGYAAHVFTVSNDEAYLVPVSVPTELAQGVAESSRLPVRTVTGRHVARGVVDQVSEDPASPGRKLIRLLIDGADFPPQMAANLTGMKFDVLLPISDRDMSS